MRILTSLVLSSVSLAALSVPAFAQSAPAQDEATTVADSDIIVTARRKDESKQDVPLVVNAVTAESITKLNLREFTDIQRVVPGLNMAANANGIGTTSSVRGVNYDVNASGNNGTIEYYLNDAPISSGPLFTAMYDVGQIEVLRGPQGTLRGRASPSGSITVTARRPNMTEVGAVLEGTINDIGTRNVKVAMNIPLVKDVLAIRLAGLYDQNEGNRVLGTNDTADKPMVKTKSGRISLRFTPADFIEVNGMYQKIDRESAQFEQVASFSNFAAGVPASAVVINPNDRLSNEPGLQTYHQYFDIFDWSVALRGFGQKLTYVGSVTKQHMLSQNVGDPAYFFRGAQFGQSTDSRAKQESHEVRLQNEERLFGMADYVIGYFRNSLNSPTNLIQRTPVGFNFGSFGALATVANTNIARRGPSLETSVFGNLTLHIGDRTELSGGVRHINYHSQGELYIGCPNYDDCAPLAAAHEDSKRSHTIYTASLKHRFNDNLMAYFNFGTSWRPGPNVIGDFSLNRSALENSFLILPDETSKSYELGIKSDWFDKRLTLNVAVYQQDYNNFPYRSSSGVYYVNYTFVSPNVVPAVGTFNFVGAVPVRVRGVEAEGSFKVTPNWTIGGNLNYSLGRLKNGLMPCNDLNGDGKPDALTVAPTLAQLQTAYGANNLGACRLNIRSASAPVWSGTVNTEYEHALSGKLNGYLRGLWSWQGKTGNDPQNAFDDIKAHSNLNLYVGIRAADGAWDLSLFAKNLTNDRTVLSVSNGPLTTSYQSLPYVLVAGRPSPTGRPAAATASSTYAGITMVAPREFGASLRIALGSR
ncbi:MAG: TonB-dependent receptor [Sphingomonadales bacterium]|nr:TonB-dependent receptor [Sphingomonadales bacterium]